MIGWLINTDSAANPTAKKGDHEEPAVGSVSGGGRYDGLVGMFDHKGRKVSPACHYYMFFFFVSFVCSFRTCHLFLTIFGVVED